MYFNQLKNSSWLGKSKWIEHSLKNIVEFWLWLESPKRFTDWLEVWNTIYLRLASYSMWWLVTSPQFWVYCRIGFDSAGLVATEIATRNDRHHWIFAIENIPITPYMGVVFPFMGSLSFLFLGHYHENANICVAIKFYSNHDGVRLVNVRCDYDWE